MKKKFHNEKLFQGLPKEFYDIFVYINSLSFYAGPNYKYIHDLLHEVFIRSGGKATTPFDWEKPEEEIDNIDFLECSSSEEFTERVSETKYLTPANRIPIRNGHWKEKMHHSIILNTNK